jgi:hypothetical protein
MALLPAPAHLDRFLEGRTCSPSQPFGREGTESLLPMSLTSSHWPRALDLT